MATDNDETITTVQENNNQATTITTSTAPTTPMTTVQESIKQDQSNNKETSQDAQSTSSGGSLHRKMLLHHHHYHKSGGSNQSTPPITIGNGLLMTKTDVTVQSTIGQPATDTTDSVIDTRNGSRVYGVIQSVQNHYHHNHNHNHHRHHHHHNPIIENPPQNFYQDPPDRRQMPAYAARDDNDGLGPLPPKWEKAFTENGETYFIDHNTGTSHWLDPRLSKFQKKSLTDCMDDELPYGWEKINDPQYGTYFIDHVNRRTQYENPVLEAKRRSERGGKESTPPKSNFFTRNPSDLCGERVQTTLLKSSRGLGFTIVGGDDNVDEFLQIKSIVPNGPAWLDGKLQTSDVLVYVNDTCVLGFTHHDMVNVFQSILPGETVSLEVCRGYPLPFDPDDPNTEVVTTIAVDGLTEDPEKVRMLLDLNIDGNYNFLDTSDPNWGKYPIEKNPLAKIHSPDSIQNRSANPENYLTDSKVVLDKPEILNIQIVKGALGFGFTIADSAYGQKVKKILDRNCCHDLLEGDLLLAINNISVKHMSHLEVVQVLKDCPRSREATVKVQRGNYLNCNGTDGKLNLKLRKHGDARSTMGMYRSKTPTADLYSTQPKEILPTRPKTPLVDTRSRMKTPLSEVSGDDIDLKLDDKKSTDHDSITNDIPFMGVTNISDRLAEATIQDNQPLYNSVDRNQQNRNKQQQYLNSQSVESSGIDQPPTNGQEYYNNYNGPYVNQPINGYQMYSPPPPLPIMAPVPTYHHETCFCLECQEFGRNRHQMVSSTDYGQYHQYGGIPNGHRSQKRINDYMIDRQKSGFSPLENHVIGNGSSNGQFGQHPHPYWNQEQQPSPSSGSGQYGGHNHMQDEYTLSEVTLERQALGFGFRIVGGTEEGSQVTVGHIVPGGAADGDPHIASGDEILSIDGHNVVQGSHHRVVQLMGNAALRGQVTMILRRKVATMNHLKIQRAYPYDVIVSRIETEGFGFVIISSSNQFYGSTIGKLIPGSPADRCGELNVGDRIIAVNRMDIAGMSHGDVVNLIKESGLHVRLTIGNPKEILQQQQQQNGMVQHGGPILSPPGTLPVDTLMVAKDPYYDGRYAQMMAPHQQL